jgi:hypothetical protein
MPHTLHDATVMNAITKKLLGAKARKAILAAARAGYGAARALPGILAVAQANGARPEVVAAAFGFLADAGNRRGFVDILTDEDGVGVLPDDSEVAAAFALSRAIAPDGAPFVTE